MLGVTVSASSGARAPRLLGRLPAGCSRWRSGQPPSQTVLGSEAMWPSVQDEAPQQVAGRRMCGWLRRLGGRVARCPRRSAGLRVLAFGDLPVPEGARQSAGSGGATPRARMGGARGPRDTRTGSAGSSEGRGARCQAPGRRGSVVARSHAARGLQRAHRQPHTTRHPGPRGSRPAPPLRAWGSFRNPTGTVLGRAAPLPLTPGRDGRTWCPRTLRPPRTQSNPPCCSGKSQMQTSLSLQTAGWYRHRREV